MTKAEKVILTIAMATIVTVFGIGINNVYGETFEDHIKIPIPDDVTGQEKKSRMTIQTDNLLEFQITYRFHTAGNFTQWQEEILLGESSVNVTDNEIPELESNFVPDKKPNDLLRFESLLEYYKIHPPTSYDDLDEYHKLQELEKCLQGLDNTRGIQNEREFYTSEFEENYTVPKSTEASPLDIAIEECHAQLNYMEPLLGRGEPTKEGDYLSAQDFFGREQAYHADDPIIPEGWSVIPNHESDSKDVRDESAYAEREEITAFERMCESEFVTLKYKIQQGCEDIDVYHNGDEIVWNDTGVGEGRQQGWYNGKITYVTQWTEAEQLEKIQAQIDKEKGMRMFAFNTAEWTDRPSEYNQRLKLPTEGWDMVPKNERTQELRECYISNWNNKFVCGE